MMVGHGHGVSTPNRIFLTLNPGGDIAVANRDPRAAFQAQVWARAGATVTFIIENRDKVDHTVTIPLSAAVPSTRYTPRATAVSPVRRGSETVRVAAGEDEEITFSVRPASHFGFFSRDPFLPAMTYKYSIYWGPEAGTEFVEDPDIEIRP